MILKYIPITLMKGERTTINNNPIVVSAAMGGDPMGGDPMGDPMASGTGYDSPDLIPYFTVPDYYGYTIPEPHFRLNIHSIRRVDSLQQSWQYFKNIDCTPLESLYNYDFLPPLTWAIDESLYTPPKSYILENVFIDLSGNGILDYKILGISYIVPHKKN